MNSIRTITHGGIKTILWFGTSALIFETGNIIVSFGKGLQGGELTVPGALLAVIGRAWQLGASIPALVGVGAAFHTYDQTTSKDS